jgi:hypothetical protein
MPHNPVEDDKPGDDEEEHDGVHWGTKIMGGQV